LNEATRAAVARVLGAAVTGAEPLSGGDINAAYQLELDDGRRVFAKTNDRAPPGFFAAESRGLSWLAEARALRLPEVLGSGAGGAGASPFLLLEWIDAGARGPDFDERLGARLASLHRAGAPGFGFEQDNFIALLPQSNRSAPSWAEFYRERRLLPLIERARGRGLSDASLDGSLDRLLPRLEELVGPPEPVARLHGDLWGGNLQVDAAGQPVLIDPAVYGGHREVDLAMMRLFGGFGPRVFDAYAASYPLEPGHRERVALYQLYPLLVHLCSFGAGYRAQLKSAIARYL
jgi:fructosamine-3-kinase